MHDPGWFLRDTNWRHKRLSQSLSIVGGLRHYFCTSPFLKAYIVHHQKGLHLPNQTQPGGGGGGGERRQRRWATFDNSGKLDRYKLDRGGTSAWKNDRRVPVFARFKFCVSFLWRFIGASLKWAPQLRVDLAFCHDIYIDRPTSIFDPAPGIKVGCCGQNLRVVFFVWEQSSVLIHIPSHSSLIDLVGV